MAAFPTRLSLTAPAHSSVVALPHGQVSRGVEAIKLYRLRLSMAIIHMVGAEGRLEGVRAPRTCRWAQLVVVAMRFRQTL